MALTTSGVYSATTAPATPGMGVLAHREQVAAAILAGASGTVHVMLEGGGSLTGIVDTSHIGDLTHTSGNVLGGIVLITDSGSVQWVVPLERIVAVGQ